LWIAEGVRKEIPVDIVEQCVKISPGKDNPKKSMPLK
jgi:hypothetical protein